MSDGDDRDRGECEDQKNFDWDDRALCAEITCLEIWCVIGEQEVVYVKHKVNGWDQLGSSELKEEIFGYHIVRQL